MKTENEDLKLNLRTQQEKVDQLQDEMDRKNQDIKGLVQSKYELNLLRKKYDDLQNEKNEIYSTLSKQDVKKLDNEMKVDELQILNKNQLAGHKQMEQNLKNEIILLENKITNLEVRLKESESNLSMLTT